MLVITRAYLNIKSEREQFHLRISNARYIMTRMISIFIATSMSSVDRPDGVARESRMANNCLYDKDKEEKKNRGAR